MFEKAGHPELRALAGGFEQVSDRPHGCRRADLAQVAAAVPVSPRGHTAQIDILGKLLIPEQHLPQEEGTRSLRGKRGQLDHHCSQILYACPESLSTGLHNNLAVVLYMLAACSVELLMHLLCRLQRASKLSSARERNAEYCEARRPAFRMASLAFLFGMSQKMRREKRLSTASSRSCGRFVAPRTTTRSLVLPPDVLHHIEED